MKMLKRLIILVLLFSFLVPIGSVFAYSGGLLHGKTMNRGVDHNSITNANVTTLTDGNLSTGGGIQQAVAGYNDTWWATFDTVKNIDAYQIATNANFASALDFYGEDGTLITTIVQPVYGGVKTSIPVVENVKKVAFRSTYTSSSGFTIYEFDVFEVAVPRDEITNLNATYENSSVKLTWNIPTSNTAFTGSKIYKDGNLIGETGATETSFIDSEVTPGGSYSYKVVAVYSDGVQTAGITKDFTIIAPPGNVRDLKAESEYNKVKLSWTLPTDGNFQMVRIYRDKVETAFLGGLFGSTAYAAETPIFETNGSYFNDLSVEPSTQYEYTVTSVSDDGLESEGVTTQTETAAEPIPIMEGLDYSINENGDYVYTWEQPTSGNVRVIINGTEYASVPGEQGSVTIPHEDMQLNGFGDPETSFQPIGEFGAVGRVYEMEGRTILTPFTPMDLIQSGMQLLTMVAPFLLLALAFLLVPKFRKIIYAAFGRFRKDSEGLPGERRSSQDEPKEKHEGKEHLEKKERIERAEKERQERENRERLERERERVSKEIKTIQEKEAKEEKERARQPKERRERTLRAFGRVRQPRQERAPRERIKEPRQPRETREPRARRERRG